MGMASSGARAPNVQKTGQGAGSNRKTWSHFSSKAFPQAKRRQHIPLSLFNAVIRGLDLALLATVALLAACWAAASTPAELTLAQLAPHALIGLGCIMSLAASDAWHIEHGASRQKHWAKVVSSNGAFTFLVAALSAVSGFVLLHDAIETAFWLWFAGAMAHAAYIAAAGYLGHAGLLSENVVIVGATENARQLIARNAETGELNIVGVFDDRLSRSPTTIDGVPVLGSLDDLLGWPTLPEMDRIVVTVSSDARDRVKMLIDRLRILPQRVVLLLDLQGFNPEQESLSEIAQSPAAYVSGRPLDLRRAVLKRAADIVFACGLLVLFTPILIATAIAVRLESRGPLFFRQSRHGFNNQIIRVWKFRSMKPDRDAETRMTAQTTENDPRVTRVGRFIRATSIDELPQLINVLKGEMSLVGPRPHALGMTAETSEVQTLVSEYAHRHRVKPGLTGWAQINGSRGPVHTKEEVRERVRLDLEYVNRAAFWFDLYIMVKTAPCLLGDRLAQR